MSLKSRIRGFSRRHPFAAWGVPGFLLWVIFQVAWELIKDAVLGWVNQQLARGADSITVPIEQAWPVLIAIAPPVLLAVTGMGITFVVYKVGFALLMFYYVVKPCTYSTQRSI